MLTAARALVDGVLPTLQQRGLTLVGIAVANLENAQRLQLLLPFDGRRQEDLDAVVDEVRERFGSKAITRAVLLGRDAGYTMPMLPD